MMISESLVVSGQKYVQSTEFSMLLCSLYEAALVLFTVLITDYNDYIYRRSDYLRHLSGPAPLSMKLRNGIV